MTSRRYITHRSTEGDGPDDILSVRPDWHAHARCRGITDWFDHHPDGTQRKIHAEQIALCSVCPVRLECANDVLDQTRPRAGVWAGVIIPRNGSHARAMRILEELTGRVRVNPLANRHGTWPALKAHRAAGEVPCAECYDVQVRRAVQHAEYRARKKGVA